MRATAASYFSPFLKTGKTFDCHLSSGTPPANDSLEVSASIGEISLLHPFSTLAFSDQSIRARYFINVHLVRPIDWRPLSGHLFCLPWRRRDEHIKMAGQSGSRMFHPHNVSPFISTLAISHYFAPNTISSGKFLPGRFPPNIFYYLFHKCTVFHG